MDLTKTEHFKTGMTFSHQGTYSPYRVVAVDCGGIAFIRSDGGIAVLTPLDFARKNPVHLPQYPYVGQERAFEVTGNLIYVKCISDGFCGYRNGDLNSFRPIGDIMKDSHPTETEKAQHKYSHIHEFLATAGLDNVSRADFTKAVAEALESPLIKQGLKEEASP